MAASSNQLTLPAASHLVSRAYNVALGYAWFGVMLIIMSFWLGTRAYVLGKGLIWVVALLGIAGLVLAIWQALWVRKQLQSQSEPEVLAKTLAGCAKRDSMTLLVAGLCCFGLACWVGYLEGLSAFGEVAGLVVLGAILDVSGLMLRGPTEPGARQDSFLGWLQKHRGALQMVSFALGIGGLAAATVILMKYRWAGAVLGVGSLLVGLSFLAAGLWASLARAEELTPSNLRLLLLICGGLVGLFLSLTMLLQVLRWWLDGWRDVETWSTWLVLYAELLGLAIMFGSLLAGKADIRKNPVIRRVLYGYNAAISGLVLFVCLVVLILIVNKSFPGNMLWSKSRGLQGLSPKSIKILENLKEPVKIYVTLGPGTLVYQDTQMLLENCRDYSRNLALEYISPDKEPAKFKELARKYPVLVKAKATRFNNEDEDASRGLLVVYGLETDQKLGHAFISQQDLGKKPQDELHEMAREQVYVYNGEDRLMTQLRILVDREQKPRVYFTQGNDEYDVDDASLTGDPTRYRGFVAGAGEAVGRLKNDNYEIRSLVWGAPRGAQVPTELRTFSKAKPDAPHVIPADAKVIIIADPQIPFKADVVDALKEYLERETTLPDKTKVKEGRLLIVSSTPYTGDTLANLRVVDIGLNGLLKKYNVQMENNFVLQFPEGGRGHPLQLVATVPGDVANPLTNDFRNSAFPVFAPREVKPLQESAEYRAEVLLEIRQGKGNGQFWAESDGRGLLDGRFNEDLLFKGLQQNKPSTKPIPIAVGVLDRNNKPRIVVIGDNKFLQNGYAARKFPYYDFFTSAMEWMADRPEKMGISPQESNFFALQPANLNYWRLVLLPFSLMMLAFAGLGVGLWVVRRR